MAQLYQDILARGGVPIGEDTNDERALKQKKTKFDMYKTLRDSGYDSKSAYYATIGDGKEGQDNLQNMLGGFAEKVSGGKVKIPKAGPPEGLDAMDSTEYKKRLDILNKELEITGRKNDLAGVRNEEEELAFQEDILDLEKKRDEAANRAEVKQRAEEIADSKKKSEKTKFDISELKLKEQQIKAAEIVNFEKTTIDMNTATKKVYSSLYELDGMEFLTALNELRDKEVGARAKGVDIDGILKVLGMSLEEFQGGIKNKEKLNKIQETLRVWFKKKK